MTIGSLQVHRRILTKLTSGGVADVTAQLWPGDCQTCGRALDPVGGVALVVDDLMSTANASLHHPTCQKSRWNDTGLVMGSSEPLLTHATQLLMTPMGSSEDQMQLYPVLLVNPGLEQVPLRPVGKSWRVGTVDFYAETFGMELADRMGETPLADTSAFMLGNEVAVQCGPFAWLSAASLECGARIRELGGVMVLVTTVVDPRQLELRTLGSAVRAGQVVGGWVTLADSAAAPSADILRQFMEPESD